MKIKSLFKDYYDHIAYQYGGGDPKCIYERKPLTTKLYLDVEHHINNTLLTRIILQDDSSRKFIYSILCVCGKYYTIARDKNENEWQLFDKNKHFSDFIPRYSYYFKPDVNFIGQIYADFISLFKKVNAPVFLIADYHTEFIDKHIKNHIVKIDAAIPKLGDIIGFAAIYPPEQLYQDISHYITNVLNDNPDTVPPATVSDKDRIQQHGFDLKKSFRHRK